MKLSTLLVGALALLLATVTRAFDNPFLWEDLADLDVRQYNGTYYYSASSMHYSPGAPLLQSYDLINWEYIGHSVPSLDQFGSQYDLTNGQRAYVEGVWASFFGFHPQKNTWFWGGCINFWTTYINSAPSPSGPWTQYAQIDKCYYDCGLLVDDDGTMYVSYSNNSNIWVAQLSADGKSEVKSEQIWIPPTDVGGVEGTRMYKISGKYYIFTDHPSTAEYVLMASSPFGTYSYKALVNNVGSPLTDGGPPHQGGVVETPSGQWYYMAFIDSYPGGRIPILAPMTFGSDGFPTVTLSGNNWETSYPDPVTSHPLAPFTGVDYLTSLGPQWEWNHVPDATKYSTGSGGLTLDTATVTNDLYQARNTLTHRILGPTSTATIKLNYGSMLAGDRAGLSLFRDYSAWIGVMNDGGTPSINMVTGIDMGSGWVTIATGTVAASAPLTSASASTVWLRATANIAPSGPKTATFSYSTDGSTFESLGGAFALNTTWNYFMGYRFGIFNYATDELGGHVTVSEFQLDAGDGSTPASVPTSGSSGSTSGGSTSGGSTSGGSTSTVSQYGQCGGQGYTGPTTCASSYTCKYSNPYYSQCL